MQDIQTYLSPPHRSPTYTVTPWEKKQPRRAEAGKRENKSARATLGTPRSRFLSPALPLPFLSLVFTNRSLCGGESKRTRLLTRIFQFFSVIILLSTPQRKTTNTNRANTQSMTNTAMNKSNRVAYLSSSARASLKSLSKSARQANAIQIAIC